MTTQKSVTWYASSGIPQVLGFIGWPMAVWVGDYTVAWTALELGGSSSPRSSDTLPVNAKKNHVA